MKLTLLSCNHEWPSVGEVVALFKRNVSRLPSRPHTPTMKIFPSRDADGKSRHRVKWNPKKTMTDINSTKHPKRPATFLKPESRDPNGSLALVFAWLPPGSSGLLDVDSMRTGDSREAKDVIR